MIRAYYSARILTGRDPKGHDSALLRAVAAGNARTFLIFGGQGYEDYFDELTSLYHTYSVLIGEFVQHMASHLLYLGFWILRIDLMVNICLLHQLVYLVLGLCNWLCMVLLVVFSAKIPVFF